MADYAQNFPSIFCDRGPDEAESFVKVSKNQNFLGLTPLSRRDVVLIYW